MCFIRFFEKFTEVVSTEFCQVDQTFFDFWNIISLDGCGSYMTHIAGSEYSYVAHISKHVQPHRNLSAFKQLYFQMWTKMSLCQDSVVSKVL